MEKTILPFNEFCERIAERVLVVSVDKSTNVWFYLLDDGKVLVDVSVHDNDCNTILVTSSSNRYLKEDAYAFYQLLCKL